MYFTISFVLALAATTVVSLPSPKDRREVRIARRAPGVHEASSNLNPQPGITSGVAGVVMNGSAGSFSSVKASFVIPTLTVPEGGDPATTFSAAAWVGLDVDTCQTASLLAGIASSIYPDGSEISGAYYQSSLGAMVGIPGISLAVGDNITVTVTATNATSGTVVIVNQSTDQTVSEVISTGTLCGQDVDVVVQDFSTSGGSQVPFADFGMVNFTDVSAETPSGTVGITAPTIFDIGQNGTIITSVLVSSSSVMVAYL